MPPGKRTSLVSLAGAKVDDVPGRSDPLLLSLPLDKVVPTRFNPRRRFGTEDELRDFGQKLAANQLQPAVVVSRTAYLKLWPDEAEAVGEASYVIANGERRYRASLLVGRPALEVVHREDVAASRASFLDAVQSENNDRENLDPIERALGIDIMVTQLGGAKQVALHYGKTDGWVSQQRKLLRLTPELQDLVSSGELPVRVARDIAGLPAEVQSTAWEEELAKRKAAKEAADRWKTAPEPALESEPRFTAVNQSRPEPSAPPSEPALEEPGFTAVKREPDPAPPQTVSMAVVNGVQPPGAEPVGDTVPVPREAADAAPDAAGEDRQPKRFPYDDGTFAAQLLIHRMPPEEFDTMLDLLAEHRAKLTADAR